MTPTQLPCGPTAVLAEVATLAEATALAAHVRHLAVPGVIEIIPGARTVLVVVDGADTLQLMSSILDGDLALDVGAPSPGPLVEVPTVYAGEDLGEIGRVTGLSLPEIIEAHSSTEYVAAFSGFSPGFVYLVGLVDALQLPRRRVPRPFVSAGSVAIGAEFTGVYPRSAPGGWHLLGYTTTEMWDPTRVRPAHIAPGDRVRFVPALP